MRKLLLMFLLTLGTIMSAAGAQDLPLLKSADEVLAFARSRMPSDSLLLKGTLYDKASNGYVKHAYPVDMKLAWGATPPQIEALVRDEEKRPLEKIQISFPAGRDREISFFRGPDLKPARLPSSLATVQETDITWADLTFSFLWWKNGRLIGLDSKKGRQAYLLELPAPESKRNIGKLRVWIDTTMGMILQATVSGKNGRPLRSLQVVSLEKTAGGFWMVKDLEMRPIFGGEYTKLTIESLERVE